MKFELLVLIIIYLYLEFFMDIDYLGYSINGRDIWIVIVKGNNRVYRISRKVSEDIWIYIFRSYRYGVSSMIRW